MLFHRQYLLFRKQEHCPLKRNTEGEGKYAVPHTQRQDKGHAVAAEYQLYTHTTHTRARAHTHTHTHTHWQDKGHAVAAELEHANSLLRKVCMCVYVCFRVCMCACMYLYVHQQVCGI